MEHLAARPSWDCRACGKPWPCDPAREELAATLSPIQLALYAAAHLSEAAPDMPTAPPAELYDRFMAWTRPTGAV
jgi:hypothetical protein